MALRFVSNCQDATTTKIAVILSDSLLYFVLVRRIDEAEGMENFCDLCNPRNDFGGGETVSTNFEN